VEALLIASDLDVSNLEIDARCGEVQIEGIILAEGIERTIVDMVRKIPGVTGVRTRFAVTPPDHYLYGDNR
jgi:osmotically-inducible protein OsmY